MFVWLKIRFFYQVRKLVFLEGKITLSDTVPCLVLIEYHLFEEITKKYYPAVDELIDVLEELNSHIVRYANVVSDLESAIFD